MSWVIIRRDSGEAVCELYDKDVIAKLNTEKYQAVEALEYLCALHEKIKNQGDIGDGQIFNQALKSCARK
jgi:hypothetical protein